MYAVDAYRCSDVATTDRAEWWSELVSSIHSRMAFRMRDGYRGRIEHQHTEAYQLVRWWSDEELIKRSPTDVRRHPHGAYELLVPVTGSMLIRQADTALKLEPGGLALATLDAPMDMWHSDNFSCLALVIPRARMDARIGGQLTRTTGLNAEHGMGRIVVDLLGSLRSQAHMIDGLDFDAAADRAVDLLCLAYGGALLPPMYETQDDLVAAIRRFVRANAHDLSLTGAAVAAELGWSLRQIQARLQRIGTTPSMLIREERLELARLRLQHPGWDHRTVANIAAGAVGSVAAQLARARGASLVIGSAGGSDKARYLTGTLGLDAAVDYRAGDLAGQLRGVAPEGIDLYFDNVGGDHLEAAINLLRTGGRAAICGMISGYANAPAPGPRNLAQLIIKRLRLEGFLVLDHLHRWAAFEEEMLPLVEEGALHSDVTMFDGLERAPQALLSLLDGAKLGKALVRP